MTEYIRSMFIYIYIIIYIYKYLYTIVYIRIHIHIHSSRIHELASRAPSFLPFGQPELTTVVADLSEFWTKFSYKVGPQQAANGVVTPLIRGYWDVHGT